MLAYNANPADFEEKFLEHTQKYMKPHLDAFISALPGRKVLDIGCGPGVHLEYFREQGLDAMGIDLSDAFLERCAEKGLNVRKMDFEQPLLYNYSYDGIWANAALLHVTRNRVASTVAAWTKLLKPNGILSIAVKQGSGDEYRPSKKNPERKRWFTYFSEDEIKSIFSSRFDILEGAVYTTEAGDTWINYLFKLKPASKPVFQNTR